MQSLPNVAALVEICVNMKRDTARLLSILATINALNKLSLKSMDLSPKCLRGLAFHAYAIKMFNVHHLDHIGVTNGVTAKAAKGATQRIQTLVHLTKCLAGEPMWMVMKHTFALHA